MTRLETNDSGRLNAAPPNAIAPPVHNASSTDTALPLVVIPCMTGWVCDERILEAKARWPRVYAVDLGQNHGKRAAMAEGIEWAVKAMCTSAVPSSAIAVRTRSTFASTKPG